MKTAQTKPRKSHFGSAYSAKIARIATAEPTIKVFVLLSLSLTLTACATGSSYQPPKDKPAEVENRSVAEGNMLPLPRAPKIQTRSMSNDAPSSAVVRKLMDTALSQREAGNLEGAANSLERAMRIEPRNAKLWSRLANIRFEQNLWQKSIQLANKSNTLTGSSRGLRRQNWYLIANSYNALGDSESAKKYRQKLRE
jgi:tetratricopeptide (TPR) repeat protein